MIKSFKHKGLRRYYETGSTRGIQAKHAKRLRMQLAALDTAIEIADLDIPGYGLHSLKGSRKGIWAITVSGVKPRSLRPAAKLSMFIARY